jgi:hypothetical protein
VQAVFGQLSSAASGKDHNVIRAGFDLRPSDFVKCRTPLDIPPIFVSEEIPQVDASVRTNRMKRNPPVFKEFRQMWSRHSKDVCVAFCRELLMLRND